MSRVSTARKLRRILLDSETGAIRKQGYFPLEVGLVAVSPYGVAMNNLGFQTVYRLFNEHTEVRCERVFCFSPGEAKEEKSWLSLENSRSLSYFSVLAVSLSYEQDCLMLPALLQAARLPVYSDLRRGNFPLVFCGGSVITANPEPAAPFIDVCGIGDGEKLVPAFVEVCLEGVKKGWSREHLLLEFASRDGLYVPSFYEAQPVNKNSPWVPVRKLKAAPEKVVRAVDRLGDTPAHSVIVSSVTHFKGMFLVEAARGCRWGCRFCLVCRINQPYRPAEAGRVLGVLERAPSGTRAVGLVGANLCDHPQLETILEGVAARGWRLGASSLRIDTVSDRLLGLLRECEVQSLTLAPEAATEKLLAGLGKPCAGERLFKVIEMAALRKFKNLKLYYMIGLPGEEESDREALAGQVIEIGRLLGTGMRLRVSVNPFIPKPQTAWQDEPMLAPSQIKLALRGLRRRILSARLSRVQFQAGAVAESVAQAVISIGDRRVAAAIELAALKGERFLDCLERTGVELEPLLHERKRPDSAHPWRVLESG